ncbi:hypothetical protein [Streptomyces sp. NBC_00989]|uniref:hypothetical protein n=1 Tax=Streptomyces sp. NBC_00989 TaxID=2903705 RepID=UPI00386A3004|nr:MmcQ/YjbR family DNA-binding protein [Streptomyces sp. NBC_00989]
MYKAADKVFLIVTDDPDERIITVKSEPEHTRALERGSPERRPYEPPPPAPAGRSPSRLRMAGQFAVLGPQESTNPSAYIRGNIEATLNTTV